MKSKKEKEVVGFYLRVLGYQEDDSAWAAHCLETDLVGYGKSFNKALDNLKELTIMQISFAFYKKQPSLLDRPAPPWVIETYNTLARSKLQTFTKFGKSDRKVKVTCIPMPTKLPKMDFNLVPA